jgi:hypothetical protein
MAPIGPTPPHAVPDPEELARYRHDPRLAVREDDIVCLECGASFRQLTNTHILSHGMTSADYKLAYGYNARRALMCHALRRFYTERAVRTGLAERIRRRPIVENPELRRRAGRRPILFEELLTRRDIQQRPRRRWSARDDQGRFSPASTPAVAAGISGEG